METGAKKPEEDRLGKAMKELENIMHYKDVSLETKCKIICALVFQIITMHGCESWAVKEADRRKIDSFHLWCWGRVLWLPWTSRKTNK